MIYQCICVLGIVVWLCTFHNTSQWHDNRGYVFIFPLTPLSLRNFFSTPPPLSDSVFFRQSYITLPPYPSLEWRAKHLQSPPAILHPSSSTYLQIIWYLMGADRVRGRRLEGRRVRGGGVGRGMKKCKNMEGREKRKIFCVPLREGRKETRGGRGEAYPPVHPLIFENKGDDSFGFKQHPPTHTHTHLFWSRL